MTDATGYLKMTALAAVVICSFAVSAAPAPKRTQVQTAMLEEFFALYRELNDAAHAITLVRAGTTADPSSTPEALPLMVATLRESCEAATQEETSEVVRKSALQGFATHTALGGGDCPISVRETYESRILRHDAKATQVRTKVRISQELMKPAYGDLFKVKSIYMDIDMTTTVAGGAVGLVSNISQTSETKSFGKVVSRGKLTVSGRDSGMIMAMDTTIMTGPKSQTRFRFNVKLVEVGGKYVVQDQKVWVGNLLLSQDEIDAYKIDMRAILGALAPK